MAFQAKRSGDPKSSRGKFQITNTKLQEKFQGPNSKIQCIKTVWNLEIGILNKEEYVMSKLTLSSCALALLLISNPAWAGGETGIYIGGSLGSARLDVSYSTVDFDDNELAYKIFAGYNFGIIPFIDLAIEGSYVDFGTAEGTVLGSRVETDIYGLDLFGLIGFNLGPVSLFGKAGAIYWNSDSSGGPGGGDESSTDPAFGLGLQLQLFSIAVRAEYEIFNLDVVDIELLSAGVSYTF